MNKNSIIISRGLVAFVVVLSCFVLLLMVAHRHVYALTLLNPVMYIILFCTISFLVVISPLKHIKAINLCLKILILIMLGYLISFIAVILTILITSPLPWPISFKYINPYIESLFKISTFVTTNSLLFGWAIFPLIYFLSNRIHDKYFVTLSQSAVTVWKTHDEKIFSRNESVTTLKNDDKNIIIFIVSVSCFLMQFVTLNYKDYFFIRMIYFGHSFFYFLLSFFFVSLSINHIKSIGCTIRFIFLLLSGHILSYISTLLMVLANPPEGWSDLISYHKGIFYGFVINLIAFDLLGFIIMPLIYYLSNYIYNKFLATRLQQWQPDGSVSSGSRDPLV